MSAKILIIDDDPSAFETLKTLLFGEGYALQFAASGAQGLTQAQAWQPDVILCDVMMPGLDGIQALARIRAGSTLPVLMLTGRGDDADRIVGLELGADDYVPKPCTPRELAARLRAILKRVVATSQTPAQQVWVVGDLVVRPSQRLAELAGRPLALTSTEFSLLELLASHAGRAVAKAELSLGALGRPLSRFDRSIDVHISSIRQKLGPLPDGRMRIQTVIRKGYLLVAERER